MWDLETVIIYIKSSREHHRVLKAFTEDHSMRVHYDNTPMEYTAIFHSFRDGFLGLTSTKQWG